MRRTFAVVLAAVLSTTSGTAYAQSVAAEEAPPLASQTTPPADPSAVDPAQADATTPNTQAGLADIIVTATRRNERLQDVPVAVAAITSQALTNKGVFDTSDLNGAIPNLTVSSPYGKQQPNFSVRGVGVGTEFNANAASPVGVYVDEVYQAFRSSHGQQLYDLDQIEVVKGPQGTLYGRNTTGGAINFITNAPELAGENGYFTAGYGNYNRYTMEGAVEVTPITDVLGIRLAGSYVNSDAYVHNRLPVGLNTSAAGGASGLNLNSGLQPGGVQSTALRLTVRFKPSDRIDLSVKVYGGEARGGTESQITTGQSKTNDVVDFTSPNFLFGGLFGALAPAGLVPPSYSNSANGGNDQNVFTDTIGRARSSASGVVFNAKITLAENLRLISVTDYDGGIYEQFPTTDCDGTPLRLCAIGYGAKFHAFNQDARLDYSGDRLKLILGGYYGRDYLNGANRPDFFNFLSDVRSAVGLPASYFNPGGAFNGAGLSAGSLPTGIRANQNFKQQRKSYAVYGEGSYKVTDTVKLTLGGRYTIDKNRYYDALTTYYDDAGTARLITVSDFQQNGASSPYFLQPVRDEAGVVVIPSFQGLGIPLPGGLERRGKSNRFSGRAIIDWKPTEKTLLYASFSRGYRAGTFNGLAYGTANQVYFVPPEQVNAYEAGFKTRFFDNRVQFNGSAFYYDYKGQQGQVVDATATANLISLDGTLKGFELDAQFQVAQSLLLSASLGMIDSKYDNTDCPSDPASIPNFPAQLGSCVVSGAGPVNVGGNPFPYAPKRSATAAIDWTPFDTGSDKVILHGDASYTGRFYYDSFKNYSRAPLPRVLTGQYANGEGEYVLYNARMTYSHGNYSVSAFGKNLTNKTYYPFGIALEQLFGVDHLVRGEPRTYGVEGTIRF